jgi:hypothetical protein
MSIRVRHTAREPVVRNERLEDREMPINELFESQRPPRVNREPGQCACGIGIALHFASLPRSEH